MFFFELIADFCAIFFLTEHDVKLLQTLASISYLTERVEFDVLMFILPFLSLNLCFLSI